MNEVPPSGPALQALRQELDDVDDALLALLAKRFAVTAQVKSFKRATHTTSTSPLRPAREAQILRRLLARAKIDGLGPDMVLRLWRAILTQSSFEQAPMTIHVAKKTASGVSTRLRLRDHFPNLPIEEWRDDAQALMQVNAGPGDVCIVETDGAWMEAFATGQAGTAQVIGALPVLAEDKMPKLLIIGNAPQEATGRDETLLVTQGNLPRDFPVQPLWQVKSGAHRLSALAGFFSEHESPIVGLGRSNKSLGLIVAGRYPSAFEV
jgi:chorismate mutase / prephenate dehydratase